MWKYLNAKTWLLDYHAIICTCIHLRVQIGIYYTQTFLLWGVCVHVYMYVFMYKYIYIHLYVYMWVYR